MSMIPLIASGFFEVIMVFCLNKSQGFTHKGWSAAVILFAFSSLICLSIGMTTMEAGVAYSIWVAFGSIGSLLLGVFVFGDKLNIKQVICILGVIVAVIGLKSAT